MTRIAQPAFSICHPDAAPSFCCLEPGDVDRFTADGVVSKAGTEIGPFDVVVAATGYERTYDYLPAKVWHPPDVLSPCRMQSPPVDSVVVHIEVYDPSGIRVI